MSGWEELFYKHFIRCSVRVSDDVNTLLGFVQLAAIKVIVTTIRYILYFYFYNCILIR